MKQPSSTCLHQSIILADDHPIFIYGLEIFLENYNLAGTFHRAHNGIEVLNLLKQHQSPLALIGYRMPVLDGLKATQQIRINYPLTKVVCLSGLVEENIVRKALEVGVDGFVSKEEAPETIVEAIQKVSKGEKFLSDRAKDTLIDIPFDNNIKELPAIASNKIYTGRELQISHLLLQGKTINEIAKALFLSVNTIKTHKARMFKKLGVNRLAQFIVEFRKMNW